jgi:hypothetical protein
LPSVLAESGIGYAKNNALKGRLFQRLEEDNQFLLRWEETVADTRIHGTTKRQLGPAVVFDATFSTALRPLALTLIPSH